MNISNEQARTILAIAKALTALGGDGDILRVAASCARLVDGVGIRTHAQLACDAIHHVERSATESREAFAVVRPDASQNPDTLAHAGEKARQYVAAEKLHAACVIVQGWYQNLSRSERKELSALETVAV